jgi:hypothetical protein
MKVMNSLFLAHEEVIHVALAAAMNLVQLTNWLCGKLRLRPALPLLNR